MQVCSRRDWLSAVNHGARLGAMLILLALPLQAQTVEYAQRGVPAEASAENGVIARDRALASARRLAWGRLASGMGTEGRSFSDSEIEQMVESIIIEEERTGPTRYAGTVTVNFSRSRVQAALGGGSGVGEAGQSPMPRSSAAIASVEATARYSGLREWRELRQRLGAAPEVARIEVVAIATDGARLRLTLREPPQIAADRLAAAGVQLEPLQGGAEGTAWRVGIAGRY